MTDDDGKPIRSKYVMRKVYAVSDVPKWLYPDLVKVIPISGYAEYELGACDPADFVVARIDAYFEARGAAPGEVVLIDFDD